VRPKVSFIAVVGVPEVSIAKWECSFVVIRVVTFMGLYLGIDIGGTKTAVVLGNERAETLQRESFPTDHEGGPSRVIAQIKHAICQVCKRAGIEAADVQAAGVSCGGPLDTRSGVILGPPNLPGWDEVPVVAELTSFISRPTYLENDANAGAVAEWQFGAGQGVRNMVFITAGTGFGAGLILNGQLYSGTNDMAGEIGHVRLEDYGPAAYGKTGSVDGLCGGAGIAQVARQMMDDACRRGERSVLFSRCGPLTAQVVAEAALAGDVLARQVIQRVGYYWGRALAILIDILNPQRVVLGSLAVRLGEAVLGPAREVVRREALPRAASVCEIVPAQLGERLGDVAALCVAMRLGKT
jgi:glucokinase